MVWYEIEGYPGSYAPRAETKDRVKWFLLGLLLDVTGAVVAYVRVCRQTPKIWPMHKRAVKWAAAGCVVRYLVLAPLVEGLFGIPVSTTLPH